MKKLFKAWLSVTLAAIFVFGLFPFADISIANAADAVYGDYTYTVDEKKKTAEITGRSGSALDLSLPLKIGEYTVTSVADGAFKDTPVLKLQYRIPLPKSEVRLLPTVHSLILLSSATEQKQSA